ncbi:MAG: hypothetical protein H7840_16855, partial [Alphaproteobacteria bacterium]
LSGGDTFRNYGLIDINIGTFTVTDSDNLGTFINETGGTITIATGATLSTSGVGTYTNNGTVTVGASPGLGIIEGDFAQGTTGHYQAELAGTQSGTGYDVLRVTGHFTLGGLVDVSLLYGFQPSVGDTFRVAQWDTYSGLFDAITGRDPGTGVVLDAVYRSDGLDLVGRAAADAGDHGRTILEFAPAGGTITLTRAQTESLSELHGSAGEDRLVFSDAGTLDLSDQTVTGIERVEGSGGADTLIAASDGTAFAGRGGADVLTFRGGADTLVIESLSDGAAVGSNTGYDRVTGFDGAGGDRIVIDGALKTALDDAGTPDGALSLARDSAANFGAGGVEGLDLGGLHDSDLTQDGFTTLIATLNDHGNGRGVTAAMGDDGLILAHGETETAVFAYVENGDQTNHVSTGELTLLAVIDSQVSHTQVAFGHS